VERQDDLERREPMIDETTDSTVDDGDKHATTGGAAAAGAITGGVVGLVGGPVGAVVGAVGGAILGAAAERVMHHDDDAERGAMGYDNDHDSNPMIESRDREGYAASGDRRVESDAGETMQLREEEVRARAVPTQVGEVRLGKEVVSEERTIDVPVSREEVYIERQPVDRRPSDSPIAQSETHSIEVPVRSEEVTVEKTPVVYEEVAAGTRQVQETRSVDATVRREELRVDREGDARMSSADNADTER